MCSWKTARSLENSQEWLFHWKSRLYLQAASIGSAAEMSCCRR
jgi:hypothetical protein